MLVATHILWRGAGRPYVEDVQAGSGPCWWCGVDLAETDGMGRPVSVVPETFPDRCYAAAPSATCLCAACGWSLCDRISLPARYAAERIAAKVERGGRAIVSVNGAKAGRYLVLGLSSGLVGLWSPGPNAAAEIAWMEAVPQLRTEPRDVGDRKLLQVVPLDVLGSEPTEKFRSYHHFGTCSTWTPATDSMKPEIRRWLLSPPSEPWVAAIGDGKGHAAIYTQASDGGEISTVYYRPFRENVTYRAPVLAGLVRAVETLVLAGANDDEIVTGRYTSPVGLLALRGADRVVDLARGSTLLDLALYLRRSRKELTG